MSARWIDLHTHLDGLEVTASEAVQEAVRCGVERMITIGTGPHDLDVVYQIAKSHQPYVACLLGVHPHEAKHYSPQVDSQLRALAQDPVCVGIGEIGLDYFYKNSDPEIQKKVFESQMKLAADLQLPVQIHTRDADDDTVDILKAFQGQVAGVFHCFSGGQALAEQALQLGYDLSFSGIFTFKNAETLREIARWAPLDRIHVETDAPFLTPVPHRGKKNRPAYVSHCGEFMANLKSLSPSELSQRLRQNALRRFPRLAWP